MKKTWLLLLLCLSAGCSGYRWPAFGEVYDVACRVLATDRSLPQGVRPRDIEEAVISMGKNMACVELPYDHAGAPADPAEGVYVVWFKRVRLRWEPDRIGWGTLEDETHADL
jgi:hypothetical protein